MEADEFIRACRGPIQTIEAAASGDLAAVYQLARTYALAVDLRDVDLALSVFAPDSRADGMAGSSPIGEYMPRVIDGVSGFKATTHNITNQYGVIDGDRGTVWSYCLAIHIQPDGSDKDDLHIGVTYRDQVERRAEGWLITHRHTVPSWVRGQLPIDEAD